LNSKISDKDKKDWENFLSEKETLPDKDYNLEKNLTKHTDTFDLHGYSLDEANIKIKELIKHSYNNGIKKLVIVTGKGLHSKNESDPYISKNLGILKHSVPEFIKSDNELMSKINNIEEANIEDGGSGAFYIHLKKRKDR
jgi:DNA-nicking Smr family endonuclease